MTVQTRNLPSKEPHNYTLAEYLLREARVASKHEFYNGLIIKMAGAKFKHNAIASNTLSALNAALKTLEKKYWAINSDQKVYLESENIALYPDALVICEKPEYWNGREDLLTNPLLIVEVASKTTRQYDRGEKFMLYRSLPSFRPNELVVIELIEYTHF